MGEEQKTAQDQQAPAPEALSVQQTGDGTVGSTEPTDVAAVSSLVDTVKKSAPPKRLGYKPSHRATFVGLTVVAVVLIVNALIIAFVMRGQADSAATQSDAVTISSDALSKLGVDRNPAGGDSTVLTIGPDTKFGGNVVVAGTTTLSGQLNLNDKFIASNASITKLEAGDTALSELNVNGDGTISTLNLRNDLNVTGVTRLQGAVAINSLTTVNNNMNVTGNLAVGGELSVRNFQVRTLTVAGHLVSTGASPTAAKGGAVGSGGTVSVSGNDTAGTVAINCGLGAGDGLLATITFAEGYPSTPHIVMTSIGHSTPGVYISNRTATGFSIYASGSLSVAGYAFDYIVVQ